MFDSRTVPEFAMCNIRPPPPALPPFTTIVYLCLSVIAPVSYSLAIDFPYLHFHIRTSDSRGYLELAAR